MKQLPSGARSLRATEKIDTKVTFGGKYRVLAVFLISAALLTAAFAASSIWRTTESGRAFFERVSAFFGGDGDSTSPPASDVTLPSEDAPQNEPPASSVDGIAIIDRDLSCTTLGESYFLNETSYQPNVNALLGASPTFDYDENSDNPIVLIVHTHTAESYQQERTDRLTGSISDATYSDDRGSNMIAVGRVLAERLIENGIPTLHCTVDHMGEGMSLQGAYARSAESVQAYLKQYPSIKLVIDLHRDAVLTSDGAYVRSVSSGEERAAQVMAVVGSDANGTPCSWEGNFALALSLRRMLNQSCDGIARPVYLRRSSFNQELAPYSLLLEIGTGANSLDEAKRTAQRVGDALAEIIRSN